MSKPFTIHTVASMHALGAILTQHDDAGNEYVVAYASKLLKGAELNFGITTKEGLGVWWACKVFFPYIDNVEFDICTDHVALTSFMKTKDISGRMARMALELQGLKIRNIIHRKGLLHNNVDTLLRPPLSALDVDVNKTVVTLKAEVEASPKQLDPYEDLALIHFLRFGKHLNGLSNKQVKRVDAIASIFRLVKSNSAESFLLEILKDGGYLNYPRKADREKMILHCHLLGHFKSESTFNKVKEKYFWKNMADDVKSVVSRCTACHEGAVVPIVYHPAKALEILGLGDKIGIDLSFGYEMSDEGFIGLFV
jgi:hypothetical protein